MMQLILARVLLPPRRWLQRGETHLLRRLGGPVLGGRVLELGCGSGHGIRLILDVTGACDAVFDFAIIHHVPDWRTVIAEVVRVLQPGGRFSFDEVTAAALATRGYQWLFDHPTQDRFTAAEFVTELQRQGLHVRAWRTYLRGRDLLGVAERPG